MDKTFGFNAQTLSKANRIGSLQAVEEDSYSGLEYDEKSRSFTLDGKKYNINFDQLPSSIRDQILEGENLSLDRFESIIN